MTQFEVELRELINRNSMENGSDTPDFILAEYLSRCLETFDAIVVKRAEWYGQYGKTFAAEVRKGGLGTPVQLSTGVGGASGPAANLEDCQRPAKPLKKWDRAGR